MVNEYVDERLESTFMYQKSWLKGTYDDKIVVYYTYMYIPM